MYIEENTSTLGWDDDNILSYGLCVSSGTLDFWNDPEEDIYTFEDGEPVFE